MNYLYLRFKLNSICLFLSVTSDFLYYCDDLSFKDPFSEEYKVS